MKRGILLQDIGQLAMDKGILDYFDAECIHAKLGEEMLSSFDWPIVKAIVLHHHCNLKSKDYPADLPETVKKIIGIVTICNRLDELYYSDSEISTERVFSMLKAETEKGLWNRSDYELICQITENGRLLGSR